jgi:hypothetical protein
MDYVMAGLGVLVTELPELIAEIVLLVFAFINWQRLPRVSMFAASGAGLMLLSGLMSPPLVVAQFKMYEKDLTPAELGKLMGVIGLARSVISAIGISLIVGAVFAERGANKPA